MTNLDRRVLLGIAGIAGAAIATQATRAGSLNPPPGPVAPTGKSTDQLEPRIDLLNAPPSANVTSDANHQYILNNPGSYYLSANLTVTKSVGILIAAANVSLDLCGFQVAGTGPNTFTGIGIGGDGAWIGNGSVSTLQYGVRDPVGSATSATLSRLRATQCSVAGIFSPTGSVLEFCAAQDNGGHGISAGSCNVLSACSATFNQGYGFLVQFGSALAQCTACGNSYSGYSTYSHCTLTDCTAYSNGTLAQPVAAGFFVQDHCVLRSCNAGENHAYYGIQTGSGCVVVDCSASNNRGPTGVMSSGGMYVDADCSVSGCTVSANTSPVSASTAGAGITCNATGNRLDSCVIASNSGSGVILAGESSVRACEVAANAFDGIVTNNGSNTLTENRCVKNNNGIHVQSGSACVVERNHLLDNTVNGLQIDSAVCFVYGNLARSNPTNYSIVAGNRVGQIVVAATNAAISGNSGGVAVTTDPYCNIAF